jgi:hypothetical protein
MPALHHFNDLETFADTSPEAKCFSYMLKERKSFV